MDGWIDFYDSAHTIYVNARHRDVHFRHIAEDLARYVAGGAAVLDYGCGEALRADIVAAKASKLFLVEPAAGVRERLSARFAGNGHIEVCGHEQLPDIADGSIDTVIMHSVAQYLTPDELDGAFALFRRVLRPEGTLVLGDIIPPETSALSDAMALLRFGAREGFFISAVTGLVRTAFSPYRRLRGQLGLTRYSEAEMIAKLGKAGFSAARQSENVGHIPGRMTFVGLAG